MSITRYVVKFNPCWPGSGHEEVGDFNTLEEAITFLHTITEQNFPGVWRETLTTTSFSQVDHIDSREYHRDVDLSSPYNMGWVSSETQE